MRKVAGMDSVAERYKYVHCKKGADSWLALALVTWHLEQYSCIFKLQPTVDVERNDSITA